MASPISGYSAEPAAVKSYADHFREWQVSAEAAFKRSAIERRMFGRELTRTLPKSKGSFARPDDQNRTDGNRCRSRCRGHDSCPRVPTLESIGMGKQIIGFFR